MNAHPQNLGRIGSDLLDKDTSSHIVQGLNPDLVREFMANAQGQSHCNLGQLPYDHRETLDAFSRVVSTGAYRALMEREIGLLAPTVNEVLVPSLRDRDCDSILLTTLGVGSAEQYRNKEHDQIAGRLEVSGIEVSARTGVDLSTSALRDFVTVAGSGATDILDNFFAWQKGNGRFCGKDAKGVQVVTMLGLTLGNLTARADAACPPTDAMVNNLLSVANGMKINDYLIVSAHHAGNSGIYGQECEEMWQIGLEKSLGFTREEAQSFKLNMFFDTNNRIEAHRLVVDKTVDWEGGLLLRKGTQIDAETSVKFTNEQYGVVFQKAGLALIGQRPEGDSDLTVYTLKKVQDIAYQPPGLH